MADNLPYDLDLFWERCNDGLSFFEEEFASARKTGKGANEWKAFAVREDDKTGSCHLSRSKANRQYLFTDFGGNNITPDGKGINAIDYVIKTRNVDFAGACSILFQQFNLPVRELDKIKPVTEFSANVTKKDGYWKVQYFKKFQDVAGLGRLFPFATPELLSEYNFKQVESYERVGTGKKGLYHMTTAATPDFPIYGYDYTDFCKLYQPSAPKGDAYLQKHSFVGTKPDRIIYGWDRLLDQVNVDAIESLESELEFAKKRDKAEILEKINDLKLDYVIIATGGTDGINIASLGHDVIWFNSETEIISKTEYFELIRFVKVVYYCPDLDTTGVNQAVKLGLMLMKIKMIWLPESLKDLKKKDAADWVRMNKGMGLPIVSAKFKQIMSQAVEFQFWKYNDKGTVILALNQMLQFLKYNGFYQYKVESSSADNTKKIEEKMFVRVVDNVVQQVFPTDIRAFVLNWLKENFISLAIQEMIIKNVFFSERSGLMSVELTNLVTRTGYIDNQLYFFNDKVVQVGKQDIKVGLAKYSKVVTWESNIIQRDFTLQDAPFKIFLDANGQYDIEIIGEPSNYFKVLINTSRIFWAKDINKAGIDEHRYKIYSPNLTADENQLQKLHLINKMFGVGHLLHKYKQKSKDFLFLLIDSKIGATSKDNKGGSGKSFITETIFNYIFNKKIIAGRNLHNEDQKFLLDGVTKETDIISYDDLSPYFDFNSLFNHVTSEITANHKGGRMFPIAYKDFAKLTISMNAVPYDITDSLSRRLITSEVSDYYHAKSAEHPEARTIGSDFKTVLFDENYPASSWVSDDNFMMYTLQFYLNTPEKIEIEQGNLMVRNLIQKIGDRDMLFFNEFFADASNFEDLSHLDSNNDRWIYMKGFYDEYKAELHAKAKISQDFKKSLQMYLEFKDWKIDFKKKKQNGNGNSVPHFLLKANDSSVIAIKKEADETENPKPVQHQMFNPNGEPETDLPF